MNQKKKRIGVKKKKASTPARHLEKKEPDKSAERRQPKLGVQTSPARQRPKTKKNAMNYPIVKVKIIN